MGRFADPYGDGDRLPEGMICTGYDADEGRRYYRDTDGSAWVGAPHADRGVLMPLRTKTTPQQDNARHGRRMFSDTVVTVHYTDGSQELALSRDAMRDPRKSATCGATPQCSPSEGILCGSGNAPTTQGGATEALEAGMDGQTWCSSPVSTVASHSPYSQPSCPHALQQTYQSFQLEMKESGRGLIETSSSMAMDSHTICWPPEGWETHLTSNGSPPQEDENGGQVDMDFDQETLRFVSRYEEAQQSPNSGLHDLQEALFGDQPSPTYFSQPLLEKEVPELPAHLDEKTGDPVAPKTKLKKSLFASLFTRNRGPR